MEDQNGGGLGPRLGESVRVREREFMAERSLPPTFFSLPPLLGDDSICTVLSVRMVDHMIPNDTSSSLPLPKEN